MAYAVETAIAPDSAIAKTSRDPLTASDREIIASVLTWDAQRPINPEEIETIAISHDLVWVKLTGDRAIPLHVETFRSIRRQQMEHQGQHQESPVNPDIEVDTDGNALYRAWKGMTIVGTFHRSPVDGKWIAFPTYGRDYLQYSIVLMN